MTLRRKMLLILYLGLAFLWGGIVFIAVRFNELFPAISGELFAFNQALIQVLLPLLVVLSLIVGLCILLLLEKWVTKRIHKLTKSVSSIGTRGDFTARIEVEGKDEIASLTNEINGMLIKLEWSHSELVDREGRLRRITDNMMDMISQINMDGIFKFISPSFEKILGYVDNDMLEKPMLDFIHPEDQRGFVAAMKTGVETSSLGAMEFRFRHVAGHYLWIESIGNLLFDEESSLVGAIFCSRDITERKSAAEALKESEEKYKQIVLDIEEGYYEVDLDGNLVFYNDSLCAIMGFSKRELQNACSDTIFTKPVSISTYYERIYNSGTPERGLVWTINKKGGGQVFVEVSIYLIRNEQGQPTGFRGLVRDVTESKLEEQKIKRMNEELERRVAERTAQLEAANKELESFSYSVSHDLRAPLRSIDGFSTALMVDFSEQLEPQAMDFLQRVRSASQRMGDLIDDLLNLSRVMRSEMTYSNVNLSRLALDVVEELKEAEPQRQVEFILEPHMVVPGDPQLLRIMLVNLLGNAWKFTGKTSEAKIEFGRSKEEGSAEFYYIKDNGAGFDMEYADKLFGPFQRLHSPGEFPGTGIGLATVERIINRHGGDVWAQGKMGEGAVFCFSFKQKEKGEPVHEEIGSAG